VVKVKEKGESETKWKRKSSYLNFSSSSSRVAIFPYSLKGVLDKLIDDFYHLKIG
jgi:hypothetical protein